jgi:hypothetical protein
MLKVQRMPTSSWWVFSKFQYDAVASRDGEAADPRS